MVCRLFITCCVLLAGCSAPASPATVGDDAGELSQIQSRLDNFEARLSALEENANGPADRWQRLAREAAIGSARLRAQIYREAADREWQTPQQLATWLCQQVDEREPKVFSTIKAAMAVEFAGGWDQRRPQAIMQSLAEGYESVE